MDIQNQIRYFYWMVFVIPLFLFGCPNNKDQSDIDQLINAIELNNLKGAKAILDRNPNLINKHLDNGYTMLHLAISRDSEALLCFSLKNGADINVETTLYKQTPLHIASYLGRYKMATILLEDGADVNRRDALLGTPLHGACLHSTKEMVALLLTFEAEVDAKTEMAETPLFYACIRQGENDDILEMIRLLLSNGADPNIKVYSGDSIIRATIAGGKNFRKAQLLEDFGATLELMTDEGMKPVTVKEAQQLFVNDGRPLQDR